MAESLPSPPDLDIVAARAAARLYRDAVARGVPEGTAWADAVVLFMIHHPAWPLPLVEAEAARTVGSLIRQEERAPAAATAGKAGKPSMRLLRALSRPFTAGTAEEEGRARSRTEERCGSTLEDARQIPLWQLPPAAAPAAQRC